jgi:aminoglycoside 6'-N-acetyltransferase
MYEAPAATEPATLKGPRVILRPAVPGEAPLLAERIATDPDASPWWGTNAEKITEWLEDPNATLYIIEVDGADSGVIMYEEETDPDYRYASIDITMFAPLVGGGFGTEALRVLAHHLFTECGHHRLQIDPAASNARAIRAYEKVGFHRVGVVRDYERGPDGQWRDALLMDMLAGELVEHPAT